MNDAHNAVELMNRLLEEAGSDYRVPLPQVGSMISDVVGSMLLAMAKLAEAKMRADDKGEQP